jgi:hypothetical protein
MREDEACHETAGKHFPVQRCPSGAAGKCGDSHDRSGDRRCRSLKGVTIGKAVFEVNNGDAGRLALYLSVIKETREGLVRDVPISRYSRNGEGFLTAFPLSRLRLLRSGRPPRPEY